jgi:hypothetical protein
MAKKKASKKKKKKAKTQPGENLAGGIKAKKAIMWRNSESERRRSESQPSAASNGLDNESG